MSELKCTHSCSDCSRLGCRSASEEQYPPFCLTTNVDNALLLRKHLKSIATTRNRV